MVICAYCKYEWEPRVDNPKVCPRCKNRMDYYLVKKSKEDEESGNQEERKEEIAVTA